MDFSAKEMTIGGLLQSEHFYFIPKYQRNYVWKESKIKDLWKDIVFNIEDGKEIKYFLGNFIIKINDKNHEIIDGQQRLTSLLILLSIICKEFINLDDNFNVNLTRKYCVLADPNIKKLISRLDNSDHIILSAIIDFCTNKSIYSTLNEYLSAIALSPSKNDNNFIKCYDIYSKFITDIIDGLTAENKVKKLNELRNTITNISIILIQVEDSKSASLVFETINARGQSLEIHDLIKNFLFMYEKPISKNSIFEKKWANIVQIIENCNDPSLPRFFTHYCTAFFGKKKKDDIFEAYKNNTERNKVADRIASFESVAKIYASIANGNDGTKNHEELNFYLNSFDKIGVTIIRPVLISLMIAFQSKKIDYNNLCSRMKKIYSFFSMYVAICSSKTNILAEIIQVYALKLNTEFSINLLNEFIEKLVQYKPDYDIFEKSFIKLAFTNHKKKYNGITLNKNKVQYVLSTYEIFEQKNEDFTISKFSLEHIKDDCLGGNACYIGNFVLLPPRKNNKLTGKNLNDKKSVYSTSCFAMTRKFSAHQKILCWNDEQIMLRGKAMANEFYNNFWKL